ncbi:hypothetical protein TVAG_229460 [Trichomonas vaginalis G3]|uniref:Nucleoporin NSP1-like C-terminal domain-containing protein n=1 Tax=Trichomonas vaginalis (strain ATCC PRA-98 / G3) TaxID=412133 RepID=A2FVJ9_TRIV3|nr:structural constituent of nuclear pore [Trichomonas vaginalis G3]EAX91076.1 hypothetical protein TVAG_229460 [Trichomonas vaginalis G3]KAI5534184.1 structural constituent of nuclear pore [Trichomonas vaginalis G3]|eukprot:XP_001304006.1 hypothetical protein [Trichomonas vaginalis G3]
MTSLTLNTNKTTGTGIGGGLGKTTGTGLGGGLGGLGKKDAQPIEIPPELKGKTVKQVLEQFEKQLEEQVRQFQNQARQVARWDREIFECLSLMQHLESQINTVEGAQKELAQTTKSLLDEQTEFIKTLTDEKEKIQIPESADQRQRLYHLAFELSNNFISMENNLKSIVEQTDKSSTESTTEVGKIEQIANCHLDAMRWIEHQTSSLEEKLDALTKKLQTIQ